MARTTSNPLTATYPRVENEQNIYSLKQTRYLFTSPGPVLVEVLAEHSRTTYKFFHLSITYHELVPALEIKLRRRLFGASSDAAARYSLSVSNRQEVV